MKRKEEKRNESNFIIFENYKEYFEMLNGEQTKLLMLSLFEFAKTGTINKHNDLSLDLVLKTMTDNIIIGSKKRIVSINNGKKGGRPKKNEVKIIDNLDKPKKEKKVVKNKYGEFEKVKLTDIEYDKVKKIYEEKIEEAINILDSYIESSGKVYKNHYAVLGKNQWVYKRIVENNVNNNQEKIRSDLKSYTEEVVW